MCNDELLGIFRSQLSVISPLEIQFLENSIDMNSEHNRCNSNIRTKTFPIKKFRVPYDGADLRFQNHRWIFGNASRSIHFGLEWTRRYRITIRHVRMTRIIDWTVIIPHEFSLNANCALVDVFELCNNPETCTLHCTLYRVQLYWTMSRVAIIR